MTTAENGQSGIVYILKNESMPEYVKIGYTDGNTQNDVQDRMRGLDTTGVPLPFYCVYAAVVPNARQVEKQLHIVFERDRRRPTREFFESVPVHSVKAALQLVGGRDVTPGAPPDEDAEGKEVVVNPSKRPRLRFSMVAIYPETELTFLKNETITCTVHDDRHVKYQNEVTSLSPLTQKLRGYSRPPAGPDYWLYEGETPTERRRRLEDEEASNDQA